MDNTFFEIKPLTIDNFKNKRVSFYYTDKFKNKEDCYFIELLEDFEKKTCLCYNNLQGNYMMTERRLSKNLLNHTKLF